MNNHKHMWRLGNCNSTKSTQVAKICLPSRLTCAVETVPLPWPEWPRRAARAGPDRKTSRGRHLRKQSSIHSDSVGRYSSPRSVNGNESAVDTFRNHLSSAPTLAISVNNVGEAQGLLLARSVGSMETACCQWRCLRLDQARIPYHRGNRWVIRERK